MKLKVACTYSRFFKEGDIVEVDAMRFSSTISSVSFRVVGVWKKPQWFDGGWFLDYDGCQVVRLKHE